MTASSFCRLVVAFAAVPALAATAAAQADGNIPARFSTGEDGLAARIEFPETRGDGKIIVRCAAKVSNRGDMNDNGCFSTGDTEANTARVFIEAVNKAAKKAKMIPARIGGQHRSVYVQYQVEFRTEGEENTVTIYNNPGVNENVEAYGIDHVAAQRTIGKEAWQRECPRHTRFLVWVRAHVAASGEQSSISLAPNEGPPITGKCETAIVRTIEQEAFAPAMDGAEPVQSTYVEPFGN